MKNLGSVLVLGLGKSGKSVVRYCVDLLGTRVSRVFVAAGVRSDDSESFLASLEREGLDWAFGDDALAACSESFDLCVASPGIPFWHELYEAGERLSCELISEVELAWRESSPETSGCKWVAITGTNGKTTTTSLTAHVLRECGFNAKAVGNIGEVCLDAVAAQNLTLGQADRQVSDEEAPLEGKVYVAELSSYQLYSSPGFRPDVAVLLNITPDHIHWHQTFEAYAQAKLELIDKVPLAILDATDEVVRAKVRELKVAGAPYIPLGTADGIRGDMRVRCGAAHAAFISESAEGDVLTVAYGEREHELLAVKDLQIKGEHNASNALAAAAVAVALGASDESIKGALASFSPLEHRLEPCGSVAGVECFNDSKATNVDAVLKALEAFPNKRVFVLLGGDDKGTELLSLVKSAYAHTVGAVCFGEAGPRFHEAFAQAADEAPEGFALLSAQHLEDAFDVALEAARSGDVILLSPACASFDEFTSFEQRGDVFKQLVKARAAQGRLKEQTQSAVQEGC